MKTEPTQIIDGITCYAPRLALENDGFSPAFFEFLYQAEAQSFWFIARNQVIQHLFRKYVGKTPPKSILEIGCGTGYVLKGLQNNFPDCQLRGSDIHLAGIKFAQKRLPQLNFVQMDATQMPYNEEFDAIGAFDVLEHITEDERVMQQVHKSLKPNGKFILSVPQYRWMWSTMDEVALHKRRYHRQALRKKLKNAGFEICYLGGFIFTLFPLMCLSRLWNKRKNAKNLDPQKAKDLELQALKLPKFVNMVFLALTRVDVWLIRLGVSLPFGGSLMVVAQKKP